MTDSCDVLIVGAGPAGCAAALALRREGVDVLLLDRALSQPFRIGESAAPDVAGYLAQLGLAHLLESHLPYHGNLSRWGGDTVQLDHFLFRAQGHGWHLDRTAFDRALLDEAAARGAKLLSRTWVEAIEPHDDGWRVSMRGQGEVVARIVVDAGGRRSPLATRIGAQRLQFDELQALACHSDVNGTLSGYSLVESCRYGWWYAAGLPDGRTLVTLMSDRGIIKSQRLDDPAQYLSAWRETQLLSGRVPPPERSLRLYAFAAHSGCISHAAGKNYLCAGDALMGLDPLTSSGIGGALSDALASAPAIIGMLDRRDDAARAYVQRANHSFKRYLTQRREHYAMERRWADEAFWCRRTEGEARLQTA